MNARTLLIVDDNASVRSALTAYFRRLNRWDRIVTADAAGEGVHLAQELEPEAIVLDNRMPGGDGIDVLPTLRGVCPQARIVMHTTEDTPALRERAAVGGVDGFVVKGRPLDELVSVLG